MVSVSIIIPVYKVEKYVEECIRSVMSQTYEGDMECIIVDDCGGDDSIAICERLISEYTGPIKFTILHHEHNRGLSAARNTGIEAATAEYLYFIDSDDYITTDCINLFASLASKYSDADIIQGRHVIKSEDFYKQNITSSPEYVDDFNWINLRLFDYSKIPWNAWNKLIKRNFILNNNLYYADRLIYEDLQWVLAAHIHIKKISFCKKPTYFYRQRNDSIMGIDSPEKNLVTRFKLTSYTFNHGQFSETRNSVIFLLYQCLFLFGYKYSGKDCTHILNQHIDEQQNLKKSLLKDPHLSWRAKFLLKLSNHQRIIPQSLFEKILNILYFKEYNYLKKTQNKQFSIN